MTPRPRPRVQTGGSATRRAVSPIPPRTLVDPTRAGHPRFAGTPSLAAAALLALLAGYASSCSSGSSADPPLVPEEPVGCAALTEECILPFPTNLLTRRAKSATGIRLNLRAENFPGETSQRVLSLYPPDLLNVNDGFSAVAPLAASLPVEPDPASFPASLEESVSSASSIRLVNVRTREQVALRIVLDPAGLELDPPRYLLKLLPARALDAGETFAVVLTDRIRTVSGGAMPAHASFARVASGEPTGDRDLDRIQDAYGPLLDFLEDDLGEPRERLVLAWAFTVRSDGDVTGIMRRVRDAVLDRARREPPAAESVQINPPIPFLEPSVEMAVLGTYPTPEYRGEDGLVQFDEEGRPIEQGENRLEFLMNMGQMLVDDIEPLNFARHVRTDPFPGDPRREVLMQESIGDGIVPNPSTESLARGLGIPLVTPSVTEVYGLPIVPAPAESTGLFQFKITENAFLAHALLLMTPKAGAQVATFFSTRHETGTGVIVDS